MPGKFGPNRGRRESVEEITTNLRSIKVEIRFDRHRGEFFAQLGGEEYRDESINGLRKTLKEKAMELDHVDWERWIEYRLDSFSRLQWRHLEGSRNRVGLRFKALELSVPQDGVVRRVREAELDKETATARFADEIPAPMGKDGETWADCDEYGSIYDPPSDALLLRYTPHRLKVLCEIYGAIQHARQKLHDLLAEGQEELEKGQEAETVADKLDAVTQVLLLPGGQDE